MYQSGKVKSEKSFWVHFRTHFPAILVAFLAVIVLSAWLELLGLRILKPGLTLTQAHEYGLLYGALRTAAGATIFGLLLLIPGLLPQRTRAWTISNFRIIWSTGAFLFLGIIAALILWAP